MTVSINTNLIPGYDPVATATDRYWFDPRAARLACEFFPECLRHIEGEVARRPFALEPWQQSVVGNLFGWKRLPRSADSPRRYREALLYVPRKNGKTPLAAGLGLYVLFCDAEEGQQNYIAAAEREQAGFLFRHAKGMVELDPDLSARCRIYGGNAAAGQSRSIVRESDGSFLRVISADASTKHGGNPHLTIIDELHTQPDPELYDTLHTAMASANRRQPLFICVTTADYDRDGSICNERYDYACGVRDGKIDDPTFLPVIFEATDKDDWTSQATWTKANPNLNVSVSLDYLRAECDKAVRFPRLQNSFKRLHLNLRTRQDELWLDMEKWRACGGAPLDLPTYATVYGGLDLSSTRDITALAWLWREDDAVCAKVRFWLPAERIRELDVKDHDPRFRIWHEQGFLEATPGDVIDYKFIQAAVVADSRAADVKEIGFDPWNARQTAIDLKENQGIEMVEVRQGYVTMNEPAKELERLVASGKFRHESNPVLDWMAEACKVRTDPAGNIKPVKPDKGQRNKIDGITAIVTGLSRLMLAPFEGSVYDTRDMLVLDY